MLSTNQRCNLFQTAVGVFLHCCNTPESVIDFLARIGVSVSVKRITRSTKSLSKQAESAIQNTARKLLSAYAYDNLDVDFKPLSDSRNNQDIPCPPNHCDFAPSSSCQTKRPRLLRDVVEDACSKSSSSDNRCTTHKST
jgi:hypothetical protein